MADKKWADIEAEEDFEPDSSTSGMGQYFLETKPDKDGIKTVTNYTKTARGETIKVIRRVKVIRKHQRINKAVYRRQAMQKFGRELDGDEDDPSERAYTVTANEDFSIEVPKSSKHAAMRSTEDEDDYYFMDLPTKTTRDLKMKFKSLKDDNANDKEQEKEPEADDRQSNRYVPPSLRSRGGDAMKSMDQQQKEECTVRVTNLSEDVKEEDLTDLFGQIGKIHRIYLAKHKETKHSKGFAFITYQRRDDAAKAIGQLNRHGYDNLLLNVEWAKPSNRERS